MRKKLISMILATVMAVSVCACGNTNAVNSSEKESQQAEAVSTETASQTTEAEAEKTLYPIVDDPITVKGLLVGNYNVDDGRIIWDKVSEITGINFEWITIDPETLSVYLASGNWEFDFILNGNCITSVYINDYGVEGGMFADYTEYLEYMPNLQKTFEKYPEALKVVKESNGAVYGLPLITEAATNTQVRAYVRTDVLEAAGITEIKTTDDFYNALKTLKEKNGAAAWCPGGLNENNYFGVWLYSAFGPSVSADFEDDGTGAVVFNRTSEQYKHYLEFLNKLYEEELMHQEYLTADAELRKALARSGEAAFLASEAHSLTEEDFADGEIHLGVLEPLTSEYDSEKKVLAQLPISMGGSFLNAESEYLVELCKVFDIMFAEEEVVEGSGLYGHCFGYGFEGVHWKYNDDNTYEQILPEGYTESFATFLSQEFSFSNTAGLFTAYKGYITSTPGNNQLRQKGFVENVLPYACDPSEVFPSSFLKFTEEEQSVITNKYTDIKTYVDEMKSKFITGVEDIDTVWDKYCNDLKVMGIDEVLEVYQAAYDRWNQ